MQLTLSCLKADVGSNGGHTRPSERMLEAARKVVRGAVGHAIIDGDVYYTGDDINLVMSHTRGAGDLEIHHEVALRAFRDATEVARAEGLYGAGQDLLVDAPSGNLRGAGPAVAEITFDHQIKRSGTERPSEAFVVFAADKCGPGAYSLPFFLALADPMYCGGLMLSPKMSGGFTFRIIDMDHTDGDRLIELAAPEDVYRIAALLRDEYRFAIEAAYSRRYPTQQLLAVSATRLHNIAGTYTGKDDPVAIMRTQGIFPATEEALEPWKKAHLVGGDCRGSHVMSIMPVPINTAVTGAYCQPIVSCLAFSLDSDGRFSRNAVDMFDNPAWDAVRARALEKSAMIREQGWFGAAMQPISELEYGGIKEILAELEQRFTVREVEAVRS